MDVRASMSRSAPKWTPLGMSTNTDSSLGRAADLVSQATASCQDGRGMLKLTTVPPPRSGAERQLPVHANAPLLHVHDPKLLALQPLGARGDRLRQPMPSSAT